MSHPFNIFQSKFIVFDLETTGADAAKDRICSIAIAFVEPSGEFKVKYMLVNPGIPIPEGATAVHGITNEMVKDKPTFAQIAKSMYDQIYGIDMAGFNIKSFDIPLLAEEFARAGLDWPSRESKVFDGLGIFQNNERRRLQDAMKFYCGKEIEDAHNAEGDVRSTIEVLAAQIQRYGFESPEQVQLNSRGSWEGDELVLKDFYDPAGKLYIDDAGDVCYNFGKAKDVKVRNDPGFGSWMLKQDFIPLVTKRMLTAYMKTMGGPKFG